MLFPKKEIILILIEKIKDKVSNLERDLISSKVRYLQWGSDYDERVGSMLIRADSQFTQILSILRRITKDLSVRIEGLVQSATLGIDSPVSCSNPSE